MEILAVILAVVAAFVVVKFISGMVKFVVLAAIVLLAVIGVVVALYFGAQKMIGKGR